jgi:colanic acid biosynthesis glycosyl transferase WcaI
VRILLLNQCFYPDVVSTAQHLTDLAVELAERGHQVTVLASRRGYDDPSIRFPKREAWKNINIVRIPSSGFGKGAKWRRAADFATFMLCCVLRLIRLPKFDVVLAMTSPPLISYLASLFVKLKGGRFIFWVMDLNPDEALAAGWLKEDSKLAKVLDSFLKSSLRRAEKVIVLDRFMQQRVIRKGIPERKVVVIPPWSHDDQVGFDPEGRLVFRAQHNLSDRFVVMYSGNHSPCHPLNTVLEAARQLAGNSDIAFCFIGGGSEFKKVETFAQNHGLKNITCLPYQPLESLAASLSAADMHLVVMGDQFAGIVHPCKIYNVLAIGAPFLYIGPAESHVADILGQLGNGMACAAKHGDVDIVKSHIVEAAKFRAVASPSQDCGPMAIDYSTRNLMPRMLEAFAFVPDRTICNSQPSRPDVQAVR